MRRLDVKDIFCAAIEKKTAAERIAYLDEVCGDDRKLREEVEELLKAHDSASHSFLKSPPGIDSTLDTSPLTEGPGTRIGRYKLLQLIGEGGFGVVYMADQERPIHRRVALKIIKLGMDTKQVIARFEAERQALAMMDHPNIARVLDAGATDTGRPYFVMELVKGIPITEYCDKNNLDTQQRLELFIDVCKAVQHAHQKGIIHRDIKPSNVMITLHDGKPVPKIIDFGIAKATQHRLTEKTVFTEFRQFIGTPEYMSPEQAEMSELDIDTRSDIYSLGVLLYELLTGTTPFEAEKLRSAAYDEIRRIIREDEPLKPSTRLSTLGDALTDIAKHRHAQPSELRRIVRGDLDWVVMKALEKDRTRRYETANEFAMDIERHLGNEPVVAGPPSTVYRLRKFARRHRTAVASGLLVATAIVVGLVVSTTLYFQAKRAREKESAARIIAEQARKKETAARDLAEQAESIAQQQRKKAQRLLARSQIECGMKLLNDGDSLGLLNLLDARITADEIPDLREQASRLWAIAYDLCSDRLVQVLPYADNLAFSPDGKLLATTNGRTAWLWDTATGRPHSPPLRFERLIGAIAFSPNGKLLAAHSLEGISRLCNTNTGQLAGPVLQRKGGPLKSSKGRNELINEAQWSASFSPDSKLLATACLDGTVRLWETDTGRPYGQPLRHNGEVRTVAFSPDGKLLASGAYDSTARLWEITSREPNCSVLKQPDWVRKIAFSPDGNLVATMVRGDLGRSAYIWLSDTGQLHKRLDHGGWLLDMAFSPDGRILATAAGDWTVRLWDVTKGEPYGEPLHHEAAVRAVAFNPDGRMLATGSVDKTLRLWDISSGRPYGQPIHHQGAVGKVVFSEDGEYIAAGAWDGTTRIWRTSQLLKTEVVPRQSGPKVGATGSTGHVLVDDIISDGKVGAIISGKTVHLWDTTTFKILGKPLRHDNYVSAAAFSPDKKLFAMGSHGADFYDYNSADIRLWEIATSRLFVPLLEIEGAVEEVVFSPDGKLLAGASQQWYANVFDVVTGRLLRTLFCNGRVWAVAFSPDGRILATGLEDGLVQQWDVATGQQLALPLRHPAQVWTVAFSPDGKLLATASGEDGRIVRLWDVSIGPPYHSLELPAQAVGSNKALGSFETDGTILVKVLPEGKAHVWRVPEAPTDLHEMQLRTWVALGAQHNEHGEATAIPWQKWQKFREELNLPELSKLRRVRVSSSQLIDKGDDVRLGVNLIWEPRLDAVAYNVYFGTNPNNLEFLGEVKDVCFIKLPPLDRETAYWWRIDTVKLDRTVIQGLLWKGSCTGKMVGWWEFNESFGGTADDSSGNGHIGKLVGDPQWQPTGGQIGGTLEFDGDGDYVNLGEEPDFDITGQITVTAWVKVNEFDSNWAAIVTKGDSAWRLHQNEDTNGLGFACSGLAGDVTEWGDVLGKVSVNDDQWHHAAGVYDGAKLCLYIDGQLDNFAAASGNININDEPVYIGENSEESGRYWNGLIDDVRIYSYALNEEEIKALYAGEGPGPTSKPKWVGNVSSKEYILTAIDLEKGDEYYVPLASEHDQEEEKLIRLEELDIKCRVLIGSEQPDDSQTWRERGDIYANMKQWDKVVADYSKSVELDPNNAYVFYLLALAHLGMGDTEGYRKSCTRMLEQLEWTDNPNNCRWAAWTCILVPEAVEDLERTIKPLELIIEGGDITDQHLCTLGAVFYRCGKFNEAIERLSTLAAKFEKAKSIEAYHTSPAYTWFFLAMAHYQLGNTDQSQRYFELAVERAEQEIAAGTWWNRELTLQLLQAEAAEPLGVSEETVRKEKGTYKHK
jgi:WD40 repeat protein/serine/threonine protein kinase/tetratricopeptide (TPR) repeat protein